MGVDASALRRAWSSYSGAGARTRAFVAARLAVAPLGALDGDLRGLGGRVLSVGCGHAVVERYLAEMNPAVSVVGVERDAERVAAARATAARAPRVEVREGDALALGSDGGFDAVLAVDLMHHLEPGDHERALRGFAAALRPGGACLVKDLATDPAWKRRWNATHDRLVAGERVHPRPPAEMAERAEAAGLTVEEVRRIDRGSPYAHYLLSARRPGG